MAANINNVSLNGVRISLGGAPPVLPVVLSWWDFEENGAGNTFSNSNGGASFFSQQPTSTMTTTGGIPVGSRKGTRTGGIFQDPPPIPDNLIYIPINSISDFRQSYSISMGGWLTLRRLVPPPQNIGGGMLSFNNIEIGMDMDTNSLWSGLFYETSDSPVDGHANAFAAPDLFPVAAPLALVVATFDYETRILSVFKDGALLSTANVSDWVGPFDDSQEEFIRNPFIGGSASNDVSDGDATTDMDFDSVFYLKNRAITASDVTFLYNSGNGRTMAEFKTHLGL